MGEWRNGKRRRLKKYVTYSNERELNDDLMDGLDKTDTDEEDAWEAQFEANKYVEKHRNSSD